MSKINGNQFSGVPSWSFSNRSKIYSSGASFASVQQSHSTISYRFIQPEDYQSLGIDLQDIPIGTFAAMDHPSFLPSRSGGNAYGFGLIEKSSLSPEDIDFLEQVEVEDPRELSRNAKQLNVIYKKLGLLIRVSYKGFRYYLIPINLVTHSLQDVKSKADEIERVLIKHVFKKNKERLRIGILTFENDWIVHELLGRMPTMSFVIFESLDKIRRFHGDFDFVILAKNIYEYLLDATGHLTTGNKIEEELLLRYSSYLMGKIFDLLGPGGEFFVIANHSWPKGPQTIEVQFKNATELKNFLIFTHVFDTDNTLYLDNNTLKTNLRDFYWYLNGGYVYDETLHELIGDRSITSLSLEEIDRLPYLKLRMKKNLVYQDEDSWEKIVYPFFEPVFQKSFKPEYLQDYLTRNVISNSELPGSLFLFLGLKRKPETSVEELDREVQSSGLAGCSLELVANYRNTFTYLLKVLRVLEDIKKGRFYKVNEIQLLRLRNLFKRKQDQSDVFYPIHEILSKKEKIEKIEKLFNPDAMEGKETSLLTNLEKMSLMGFERQVLREILLVVLGHTTLSRITFGKLPQKSLSSVTDQSKEWGLEKTIDILRVCLLMSLAEIAAALGDNLTQGQVKELFLTYESSLSVVSNKAIDWVQLDNQKLKSVGGGFNRAIRDILKLFNLFDYLDSWQEAIQRGPTQREVLCDYDQEKLSRLDKVLTLFEITELLQKRVEGFGISEKKAFFERISDCEFHGTGHLFPNLDIYSGFVLLWLTVNSAENKIINFNPLLAHLDQSEINKRTHKYSTILQSLDIVQFDYEFFLNVKEKLRSLIGYAFILGTGFQLKLNKKTGALDVLHVDIDKNLESLKQITTKYEIQRISSTSLIELKETERLFIEISEYYLYAQDNNLSDQEQLASTAEFFLWKEDEIRDCLTRFGNIVRSQLFLPEDIFSTINILSKHCPGILTYFFPEFAAMTTEQAERLTEGTIQEYVLRCLQKYQALVKGERDLFQNHKVFFQMAQEEFGPLTADSIAVSQLQLDTLETIIGNIKEKPEYLQALTISLFFRKEEQITKAFLEKSGFSYETINILYFLVKHSGLLHRIILGEDPLHALSAVTEDKSLLEIQAFFIHEVVCTAAINEGLMTEDLMDAFLTIYYLTKRVIIGNFTWAEIERGLIYEKVKSCLRKKDLGKSPQIEERTPDLQIEMENQDKTDTQFEEMSEQISAVERLFRLLGILWIEYSDVYMSNIEIPVNFIYRQKALKSRGIKKFNNDLETALRIYEAIERNDQKVREYLFQHLNYLDNEISVRRFGLVARYLDPDNCMKVLVLSMLVADNLFDPEGGPYIIDFYPLTQVIARRHEILNEALNGFSTLWLMNVKNIASKASRGINGIIIKKGDQPFKVDVSFQDPIHAEKMISELENIGTVGELKRFYETKTNYLKNLPYYTKDYQNILTRKFSERLEFLNDQHLKILGKEIRESSDFESLEDRYKILQETGIKNGFTEKQMREVTRFYERRGAKLSREILHGIQEMVDGITERDKLIQFWDEIRVFLKKYRRYIGKESELRIAKQIDKRLQKFER